MQKQKGKYEYHYYNIPAAKSGSPPGSSEICQNTTAIWIHVLEEQDVEGMRMDWQDPWNSGCLRVRAKLQCSKEVERATAYRDGYIKAWKDYAREMPQAISSNQGWTDYKEKCPQD